MSPRSIGRCAIPEGCGIWVRMHQVHCPHGRPRRHRPVLRLCPDRQSAETTRAKKNGTLRIGGPVRGGDQYQSGISVAFSIVGVAGEDGGVNCRVLANGNRRAGRTTPKEHQLSDQPQDCSSSGAHVGVCQEYRSSHFLGIGGLR